MTVTERDAWADARVAATEPVLDDELAAVRRRLRLRRAGGSVLSTVVLVGLFLGLDALLGFPTDDLWPLSHEAGFVGFGLACAGLVVMGVVGARASWRGADGSLVTPEHFLPRADRAWIRTQISEVRRVPDERRVVVTDAARRLAADQSYVAAYVGTILLYVGLLVAVPFLTTTVLFTALTVASVVRIVRAQVWAGRARRWLERYAPADPG